MAIVIIVLVVLWTTVRHEASHAAAVWLSDADLQAVRVWPSYDSTVGFSFGSVTYSGEAHWWMDAAPYIVDVALLGAGVVVLRRVTGPWRRWLFLGLVLSPVVDLVWSYLRGLGGQPGTDIADLLIALPGPAVHLAFVAATATGILAIRRLHHPATRSSPAREQPHNPVE